MKSWVYCLLFLLIVPVQAGLFNPVSIAGIKPDLALALIYVIGLLTGPTEAMLAGMGIGLLQDISSAGLVGVAGISRGLFGLCAGLLGRRVLDITSPSNIGVLAVFCIAEGLLVCAIFEMLYGDVPFFSLLLTRILPQTLYTGLIGMFIIKLMNKKHVMDIVRRRSFQKE